MQNVGVVPTFFLKKMKKKKKKKNTPKKYGSFQTTIIFKYKLLTRVGRLRQHNKACFSWPQQLKKSISIEHKYVFLQHNSLGREGW